MKKTFTINISGIIFHIDEDAYEKLHRYLEAIKNHFSGTEGKEEIIADIENRIAEILQGKTSENKQVITLDDINDVISIMGEPYEISDEEDKQFSSDEYYTHKNIKRLYRDPDNKMIGGICSGMGAYFNIDPIWFRLAFIIAALIGATGIIVYLILWMVVPVARSTAEKLEMKGERVNVANIEKSIREEIEHLKSKLNDLKDDARNAFKKKRSDFRTNYFERILDFFLNIVRYFVKGIAIIFGICLLIAGIFLAVGFIGSFFNPNHMTFITSVGFSYFSIPELLRIFFISPSQFTLAVIGLLLLIGIPLLMLIYNGIKLIMGWKLRSKYVGLAAFSFWIAGLIISGFVALQVMRSFSHKAIHSENHTLAMPSGNLLILDVNNNDTLKQYAEFEDNLLIGRWNLISVENKNIYFGIPRLDIVKSIDDKYHISIHAFSRGSSRRDAEKHAERILYNFKEEKNKAILESFYKLPYNEKWRGQHVKVLVKVPLGKSIQLSDEMQHFYKVDDYGEYKISDLPGKRWKMTENGLRLSTPSVPKENQDTISAGNTLTL